ncbi:unnamed protein product, partial [Meganyctiphanes norvegica]
VLTSPHCGLVSEYARRSINAIMYQQTTWKSWLLRLGTLMTLLFTTLSVFLLSGMLSSSKKYIQEEIAIDSISNSALSSNNALSNSVLRINSALKSNSALKELNQTLQSRLPQVLIIGAKKCGTQALGDMLSMHPRIVRAKAEKHFFEDEFNNYERGIDWYQAQMPPTAEGQITIEITPRYFISPEVPSRVHDMNSSIKLLLIVRDPVTRIISDYAHVLHRNRMWEWKPLQPFSHEIFTPDGKVDKGNFIVRPSFYGLHMINWLKVFKQEQILILDGERFLLDPLTEVIKVEKFLNLPSALNSSNFYYSAKKGFYCMKNSEKDWCMDENKGREHPRVDPKVISKLRQYFAPFNKRFYKMIGQEFNWPII